MKQKIYKKSNLTWTKRWIKVRWNKHDEMNKNREHDKTINKNITKEVGVGVHQDLMWQAKTQCFHNVQCYINVNITQCHIKIKST